MAASSLGKASGGSFQGLLSPSLLHHWHSRTWQPIMALYTLQVLYNCVDKLRLRWRGSTLNPEEPRQQGGLAQLRAGGGRGRSGPDLRPALQSPKWLTDSFFVQWRCVVAFCNGVPVFKVLNGACIAMHVLNSQWVFLFLRCTVWPPVGLSHPRTSRFPVQHGSALCCLSLIAASLTDPVTSAGQVPPSTVLGHARNTVLREHLFPSPPSPSCTFLVSPLL